MKFKITRKALLENYANIRSAGYGNLYYLLQYHEPFAYTSGTYGWNFDVYYVYGVTICIGYKGMPGKRLEGIREYEEKAKSVTGCRERVERYLMEFCKLNGGF